MGTNKIVAALIVLVAVCIGSFVAVRQLSKSETINNPVINVDNAQTATPTTAPTAAPTTAPTTTAEPSEDSSLTTFNLDDISVSEMPTSMASSLTTLPTAILPTVTTTNAPAAVTTDKYISEAAQQDGGFLGYLYDENGNFYYTNRDPWQRYFGFNAAYDFGAQFVFMFFDTARIKFNYNNMDWMVEFWKGQYGGVFIGAEIGVYYKPMDRTIEHYDAVPDKDALAMEMTFYRKGEAKLTRDYGRYWWCTGFVPGRLDKYSDRSELQIGARITMKDKAMLKAFVNGLETCKEYNFVEGDSYYVDGLDVFINW